MINSINNTNHSTNFKAIVRVKLIAGRELITETKQVRNEAQKLIRILLKTDKNEIKNPNPNGENSIIRTIFANNIKDYFIPRGYFENKKSVFQQLGLSVNTFVDKASGDVFILTRRDAELMDTAGGAIKKANSEIGKEAGEKVKKTTYKSAAEVIQERIKKKIIAKELPEVTILGHKDKKGFGIDSISFINSFLFLQPKHFR